MNESKVPVHTCHALGCTRPVAARLVMCYQHWRQVPPDLQTAVYHHYRVGQEYDKQPSIEYLLAQRAAVRHVATLEGRSIPKWLSPQMDTRMAQRYAQPSSAASDAASRSG